MDQSKLRSMSLQIAALKDSIDSLTKQNKEFEEEILRLKYELSVADKPIMYKSSELNEPKIKKAKKKKYDN